jgi:hypothetical protein
MYHHLGSVLTPYSSPAGLSATGGIFLCPAGPERTGNWRYDAKSNEAFMGDGALPKVPPAIALMRALEVVSGAFVSLVQRSKRARHPSDNSIQRFFLLVRISYF